MENGLNRNLSEAILSDSPPVRFNTSILSTQIRAYIKPKDVYGYRLYNYERPLITT